MTDHRPTHHCWVAGRTRVERVGHAMECVRCRRWHKKHKCGGIDDAKLAALDYPVEECATCNPRHPPGEFSEGPKRNLYPYREPKKVPPGDTPEARTVLKALRKEKRANRQAVRDGKVNRKMLVVLALSRGPLTSVQLRELLASFGVTASPRSTGGDLEQLLASKWVVRTQRPRARHDKAPKYVRDWEWEYAVSPLIWERMSG